jgi:hypothetical protein
MGDDDCAFHALWFISAVEREFATRHRRHPLEGSRREPRAAQKHPRGDHAPSIVLSGTGVSIRSVEQREPPCNLAVPWRFR